MLSRTGGAISRYKCWPCVTSWIEREREKEERKTARKRREEKKRRRNRSVRGWNRGESRYSEAGDTLFYLPDPAHHSHRSLSTAGLCFHQLSRLTRTRRALYFLIKMCCQFFLPKTRIHLRGTRMKIQLKSIPSNQSEPFVNFYNGTSTKKIESIRERRGARTWTLFRSVTVVGTTLLSHLLSFVSSSFRFDSYPLLDGKACSKLAGKRLIPSIPFYFHPTPPSDRLSYR